MNIKKNLLLASAVVAIGSGALLSTSQVFAQSATTDAHPMSSLVQKISQKFGLNEAEVQAVFDETHAEMEAQRKGEHEKRLSQLVTEGKITEAQKQLIIAKGEELENKMKNSRETMANKTEAERKAIMDAERKELQEWANQNGIDLKYLKFTIGRGGVSAVKMKGDVIFHAQPAVELQ